MQDVTAIVIGAGISGSLAALELAKKHKVLLVEAGDEVLPASSSSYNECYKLHTGAHFLGDLATARHCLKHAVAFARKFPSVLAGKDLSSPWRRGRHYIMSNSLVSVEKAVDVVRQLQADYAQLVAEDTQNKVFGEPEHFIRFLSKDDYPYLAESIPFYNSDNERSEAHVVLGIETAESQIDIDKLKTYVKEQIQKNPNVTLMLSREVTSLAHDPSALGCLVTTRNKMGEEQVIKARTIINCTWQNIETLNKTLGLPVPEDERVVRIKVSVLVELSESFRSMNTCIFSSGPYASITVLPNGTAVLTSERSTNVGFFKAGVAIPDSIQELLANMTLKTTQGQSIAQKILFECASYLHEDVRAAFQSLPIKELRVGFVKLTGHYTDQSIYQADSSIHSRLEDGIEEPETGVINHAAMKMTYAASNAATVNRLLAKHIILLDKMERLITDTKKKLYLEHPYLRSLNATIDLFLYQSCRGFIEDKVKSLTYDRNVEQCVNALKEKVVKKMDSFVLQQSHRLFYDFYQLLYYLIEYNLPCTSMRRLTSPSSLQRCGFFSEVRFFCSNPEGAERPALSP